MFWVTTAAAQPWPAGDFWLNACDPASLCGAGVIDDLPARLPGNWLVFRDGGLALVVRRGGRELEWRAEPHRDDLRLFGDLMGRAFRPPARITVETVAGADRELLREAGFVADMNKLVLERRYGQE